MSTSQDNLRHRRPGGLSAAVGLLIVGLLTGCAQINALRSHTIPAQVPAGQEFLRRGDAEKAAAQFDAAIKQNPADILTYRAIAEVCYQWQQWPMAIRYAERGLTAVPTAPTEDRVGLYTLIGQAYYMSGNVPEAVQAHQAAWKLAPDNPMLMNNLGYMYAELPESSRNPGILDEALKLTTAAVTKAREQNMKESDIGGFLDSLGWVYYRAGRYDEAIAALARAAEMTPDEPIIPIHLALAYHKKGRDEDASVAYERALRVPVPPPWKSRQEWLSSLDMETRRALEEIRAWRLSQPGAAPESPEKGL